MNNEGIKKVKIVVFVPESHANALRKAVGDAGAGKIGNYSHCSFSSKGQGRFLPLDGANPSIGEVGKSEIADEERIEFVCDREKAEDIISVIKKVHPYDEVAYDIYYLLNL